MRRASVAFALLMTLVRHVAAQQGDARLVGRVTDLAGMPVAGATVALTGTRQQAQTNAAGDFTLAPLPSGHVVLIVRRLGFAAMLLEPVFAPGETRMDVTLERLPQELAAVRTETKQTGLFGVVGDTAFDIVPGATVAAAIHRNETTSNEKGQFTLDVPSGPEIVTVRRDGFRPRTMGITLPPSGGAQVVVWLTPLPPGLDDATRDRLSRFTNHDAMAVTDYAFVRRRAGSSATAPSVTREQLAVSGQGLTLNDALNAIPRAQLLRARAVTCIFVDGASVPVSADRPPLEEYLADDVEAVQFLKVKDLPADLGRRCAPGGGGATRAPMNRAGAASRGGASADPMAAFILLRH